jgi:ribonuclease G
MLGPMGDSLVINSTPSEIRVALLENGTPVEIFIERKSERGVVGNVYRGRVVRVLPGMQAAFVEIGLERTAFLYVNDALPRAPVEPDAESAAAEDQSHDDASEPEGETPLGGHTGGRRGFRTGPTANIADVVSQGQEIIVQVQKEPLGTKGARITRHLTLPGRFLVFMPFSSHLGVSHRIESTEERDRLKALLTRMTPEGCGFIARTAAESIDDDTLAHEAQMLVQMWGDIQKSAQTGGPPRLLMADLDLVLRATRELFNENVERIVIDDADDFARVRDFIALISPGRETRVQHHIDAQGVFDAFGIDVALERALERRVWLKSGGYIVIDQAEALTVIDVNSGRFVGKSSLEDTITQINLEAVIEVAYQLRLRNIGGIVIIDFIDMAQASNRDKILAALAESLARDKAKTTLVRMSEIGLVEMTRKRVRDSLGHMLTESCPYCQGRGFVKSEPTVANEVLRAIRRSLAQAAGPTILVNMHPDVANYLYATQSAEIERVEEAYNTSIIPVAREGYHREHYEVVNTAMEGSVSMPRHVRRQP